MTPPNPPFAPSTPPRPRKAHGSNPYTPKSAATHRKRNFQPARPLKTPKRSPFVDLDAARDASPCETPFFVRSHVDSDIFSSPETSFSLTAPSTPSSLPGLSLFLPTPSTVGSGRKSRAEVTHMRPSTKSKPLIEKLQDLGGENGGEVSEKGHGSLLDAPIFENASFSREIPGSHLVSSPRTPPQSIHAGGFETPSKNGSSFQESPTFATNSLEDVQESEISLHTPVQNPGIEQKPQFEPFSHSDGPVSIVSVADLEKIPRIKLSNPFLDKKGAPQSHAERKTVDYSTHLELVNTRTGERKVERLSPEQQRFRPRKLDFTSAVSSPERASSEITKKYVESRIGKNFSMGETRPKGKLDFEIFSDEK
ncbi:hypothetical protein OXX79_004602 [Metschnikowia pulcherrima]